MEAGCVSKAGGTGSGQRRQFHLPTYLSSTPTSVRPRSRDGHRTYRVPSRSLHERCASPTQETVDSTAEIQRADLALPHRQHSPPHRFQRSPRLRIPRHISQQFRSPILPVRPRLFPSARTSMLMPEASVNKHHRSIFLQHQVRRPGQIASMKPKPVTEPVHDSPDCDFWTRIRSLHARHHGAPFSRRAPIGHAASLLEIPVFPTEPRAPDDWRQHTISHPAERLVVIGTNQSLPSKPRDSRRG